MNDWQEQVTGRGRGAESHRGAVDLAVACVLIPHFPLRVEILRHPELDGLPLALTGFAGIERRRIVDCSPEAAEQGIREGMLLREAVSACPQAVILAADPVHYANVYADLIRSLQSVSPDIEAGDPGLIYVDLRGLERLYGGMENIAAALLGAVPAALRPRIGLAATRFTAKVAASRARPGGIRMVPAPYSKAFLANCPVDLLPVPLAMRQRLARFGLYYLRDIARLPVGKLQAQFGSDGKRAWELAQGIDHEPFRPVKQEERVVERLALPSPTAQLETVLKGIEQIAWRIYARPEVRGRGALQARLQLLLEEHRSWERTITLKGSVADPESLARTLRYRLMSLTLDGAVEEIVLELIGLSDVYAQQKQLFDMDNSLRRRRQKDISEAIRQLKQRYGASPVYRVIGIEPRSRIPERRWGLFTWE